MLPTEIPEHADFCVMPFCHVRYVGTCFDGGLLEQNKKGANHDIREFYD